MNAPPTDSERLNAVHDALTCAYRLQVLDYLVTAESDVATVPELVEALRDHDGLPEDRNHVAVKLHHAVLPKLAALGFIEYNHQNQTVRYQRSPIVERELRRRAAVTKVA